jgi:cell wall assembly regulator SMI1
MHRTIWKVPAYLPYLQPPLSTEDIAAAEQHFGVKLPEEYIALLRQQNGGYIRASLSDDNIPHSMIWGIGPHFPNIAQYREQLDPESAEAGAWVPLSADRLVPFDGDGHWYLCLDYRDGSIPTVTFVDVELEEERSVASSFTAFLVALKPSGPKACVGVTEAVSLEQLSAALANVMKVKFELQGDDWNGYPVARANLGTTSSPAWAWVTPNSVPRGFVRREDRRYAELVGQLPGFDFRVPEHPEVIHFLDYSEECAAQVLAAVAQLGISCLKFE